MSDRRRAVERWMLCALGGGLVAYLWAVLRLEPVTYDASLSAWQWFWQSYGFALLRGLALGAAVGFALVWAVPRIAARHEES